MRKLPDFIEAYVEYTKNTESPLSYHLWSAISLIAICLERRCYQIWGHSEIFPNQYIILVGPSGVRKGEPLTIARSFLEQQGRSVIAEAVTKESLIHKMQVSMNTFQDGNRLQMQCPAAIVVEEFAVFLGENNLPFMAQLTNWYDSRGKWSYSTRGRGEEEIMGLCVNILGSMAPDWVASSIPINAIGGGFTSRIIFVVEQRKGKTITNPNTIAPNPALREKLEADLETISKLTGEFRFDDEALALYEEWYEDQDQKVALGMPAVRDPRFQGYNSRRATHVKKIAMACSAARSDSLVVGEADFQRALALLEHAEQNMPEVFGAIGRSLYAAQTKDVMDFIAAKGVATKSEVMQRFYRDIDGKTLSIIETTLIAMRFIKIEPSMESGDYSYRWTG